MSTLVGGMCSICFHMVALYRFFLIRNCFCSFFFYIFFLVWYWNARPKLSKLPASSNCICYFFTRAIPKWLTFGLCWYALPLSKMCMFCIVFILCEIWTCENPRSDPARLTGPSINKWIIFRKWMCVCNGRFCSDLADISLMSQL